MARKPRSPIPRGATLKIWNSLRERYSINPAKFKTKESLVNWIKKRNKGMAKTIKNTTFWDNTKDLYPHRTAGHTREGEYVAPYARGQVNSWKSDEINVLTNLKVRDKLKGGNLVAIFNNYYPDRTSSSILTKATRL